jgi:hypothetical protein
VTSPIIGSSPRQARPPARTPYFAQSRRAKPGLDHTKYHSAEELRDNGLGHLRDAVALVEARATTGELDGYRRFVLALAGKVAAAHREEGQSVSPAEARAIQQIAAALGTTGP